MALPNDSVLVTAGTGTTIASDLVSSNEYEVWMNADPYGHIEGGRGVWTGSQVGSIFPTGDHNLCALWNGSGSGVTLEVLSYYAQFEDAIGDTFASLNRPRTYRITAAPSAGTTRTPVKTLSSTTALPAQVLFYGEGVTASRTGDPIWFHYTNVVIAGWSGVFHRVRGLGLRLDEPIVLVEGEGIVVHGGDNTNIAQQGGQYMRFMVR